MKRTMMALSAAVLLLLPLAGCTGEQPGAGNPVPARCWSWLQPSGDRRLLDTPGGYPLLLADLF